MAEIKSVLSDNNLEVNDECVEVQFIAHRPIDRTDVGVMVSKSELREALSTELGWTIFNDADLPDVRRLLGGNARYGVGGHELNAEHINTPEKMLEVAARWIALAKHFTEQEKIDPAQVDALSDLINAVTPPMYDSIRAMAEALIKTGKITVNTDVKEN